MASAEPVNYYCEYSSNADKEGLHDSDPPYVQNFIVDPANGKGYLVGELGSSEVLVLSGEGQISFVEVTASGNVMSTAIGKDLESVHSRNTVIYGSLLASQYYGQCVER